MDSGENVSLDNNSNAGEARPLENRKYSRGLLLPLDYSGMVDSTENGQEYGGDGDGGGSGGGLDDIDRRLLPHVDAARRAEIRLQLEKSETVDDLFGILVRFRDVFENIRLPYAETVDVEQAMKDAKRESFTVNGNRYTGNVDELLASLHDLMLPLVAGQQSLSAKVREGWW
jgi:hypothetical protein